MQRLSRKPCSSCSGHAWLAYPIIAAVWLAMGAAHKSSLPPSLDDICTIFEDRHDWYAAARDSETRWGTPAHIQMAIIRQESSFKFNARPPRSKLMGFIPWKRQSNAYGFAQALDGTWERYQSEAGKPFADRDDFDDAIDFVGWYTDLSARTVGISKWDPYNQYLAYHEGQTGWRNGSFQEKSWLRESAKKVDARAKKWGAQLNRCEEKIASAWWPF